jgi:hypothetical protein
MKQYASIGACGLDCGLCPRFHADGKSRCPGCCGEGFREVHPACGFVTCCVKQKVLESCGECEELAACPRMQKNLAAAKISDSFLSYRTLAANLEFIQKNGTRALAERLQEKTAFLRLLLAGYDDGRSKGFYCLAVQLLPLDGLKAALAGEGKLIPEGSSPKDNARAVREEFGRLAEESGVELKLRTAKSSG